MLAEWVLLGNIREPINLDDSCKRRGVVGKYDVISNFIKNGVSPEHIPKDWLEEYCHADVTATMALMGKQISLLHERNQLHLVYQRGLVAACLADIEFAGLALDKGLVYEEYDKVLSEYNETKKELEAFGNINWRSGKQLRELLFTTIGFEIPKDNRRQPILTPSGEPAVNKSAFENLRAKNKEQERFIELYQKQANLNAKLTKTLEFFRGVCEDYGGVFYGSINQGRTGTHRLSASGRPILLRVETEQGIQEKFSGAQFQNLPRDYKRLFKSKREGWFQLEADSAQLEFRGATNLCNEPVALDEILHGVDIHAFTAKTLTDAGEPTTRQDAKSRSFRPLFGGSSGTKAEQEYCKFFRDKYKNITETQRQWTLEVLKTSQLVTPYGMRFYWPGTKISKTGYIDNTTAICNYPIQGLSTAEIIPLALICFWHRTKNLKLEIVNTIHDSIVAEVHPDDVQEAKETAVTCLTTDVYYLLDKLYNYKFHVPLGCGIKVGSHWGQGAEEKFEYVVQ